MVSLLPLYHVPVVRGEGSGGGGGWGGARLEWASTRFER